MPKTIMRWEREAVDNAPVGTSPGRFSVKVIDAGWGSSGFYSPEVLQETAGTAFPVGTHVYFDHPSEQEAWDRPERSVRDIVGSLSTEAAWDANGAAGPGVYAEFTPFPTYAPLVEAMAGVVGMSIHAATNQEWGAVGGQEGPIITALLPNVMNSVDIVTHAGRGGAIVAAMEGKKLGDRDKSQLTQLGLHVPSPAKPSSKQTSAEGPKKGNHKMELTEETGIKLVAAFESVAAAMTKQSADAAARVEAEAAEAASNTVSPLDTALTLVQEVDKAELDTDLRAEVFADVKSGRSATEAIARFKRIQESRVAKTGTVGSVVESGTKHVATEGADLDAQLAALGKFSKESI